MALYHFKQNTQHFNSGFYQPRKETDCWLQSTRCHSSTLTHTAHSDKPQNFCLQDLTRLAETEVLKSCYTARAMNLLDSRCTKSIVIGHTDKPVLLESVDLGIVMRETVLEELRLCRMEQEETLRRLGGC